MDIGADIAVGPRRIQVQHQMPHGVVPVGVVLDRERGLAAHAGDRLLDQLVLVLAGELVLAGAGKPERAGEQPQRRDHQGRDRQQDASIGVVRLGFGVRSIGGHRSGFVQIAQSRTDYPRNRCVFS
jgi:hypothetical protein